MSAPVAFPRPLLPLMSSSLAILTLGYATPSTAADNPAAASPTYTMDSITVTAKRQGWSDYWDGRYNVRSSNSGTKINLPVKEVPQQTSVITPQRVKDQHLQTASDVLRQAPGVSVQNVDTARTTFYSRGFNINTFAYDGIPDTVTTATSGYGFGDGTGDTAIYDRIEVVRGVDSMLSGTGNPGATVNYDYKHADSRKLTGSITGTLGSWHQGRGVVDVGGALNKSGTVRGRFVGGHDEQHSWMNRLHERNRFAYGVIDADVTDNTKASVGYSYQVTHLSHPAWGGVPFTDTQGNPTHYSRTYSIAPKNSYYDFKTSKVFGELNHDFGNGWHWRTVASYSKVNSHSRLAYITWPTASSESYAGWGNYHSIRNTAGVDSYASGPFTLFGREHQLTAGVSYNHQREHTFSNFGSLEGQEKEDFLNDPGSYSVPYGGSLEDQSDVRTTQRSAYVNSRWTLLEPVHLLLGGRYVKYRTAYTNATTHGTSTANKFVPYIGLTYDVAPNYTLFASDTKIFQPQQNRRLDGSLLDPASGRNLEGGIKGSWNNGQLTAAFSLFRIKENNAPVSTTQVVPETGEYAYTTDSVTSKGWDLEVNGAITPNLNMMFGATHFIASGRSQGSYNTFMPRTQVKLFGSYRLPQWDKLTLGGGFNWQSRTYYADDENARQNSFAVTDVFGRYQFTDALSAQLNVDNLFNQKYYSYVNSYGVFGAPRSIRVTGEFSF